MGKVYHMCFLYFQVNIWFLLCLVFCRSRIACCLENNFPPNTMGKKDTSVDTEIIGLSSDSIQNIRQYFTHIALNGKCTTFSRNLSFYREQMTVQQPRRSLSQTNITPLRTATSEALRAYHQATSSDNNSERSTSTTSQSQCGHSESKKYHRPNPNISYISGGTNEHQMAIALALANTQGYIAQVIG